VGVPGPSGFVLVVFLLGFALGATVLGEAVRQLFARRVGAWQELEALERGLLDFFLGGAVLYLLAALPFAGFYLATVLGVFAAGAVGVVWVALRRPRGTFSWRGLISPLLRPGALVVEVAAAGLLVFEVILVLPVGTGNTFDSSLLTFYTAQLLTTHQLALSFQPSASVGILYPQATTAWLGAAQMVLGFPGARTSLLLTPLFFALAPVGGFVLGRRVLGGDVGGVSFALVLAAVASWTRVLVGGSNDFVFAFPLVLWLAAHAVGWMRAVPTSADALGFGLLLGYSAALNPVGAQWIGVALVVMGLVAVPRFAGSAVRWGARWTSAMAVALVPLVPTWYVLAQGLTHPGYVPGAGPVATNAFGLGSAKFIGYVDPYFFGPADVWLSPVPALRAELAILFTAGLGILFLVGRRTLGPRFETVRAFLIAGVVAAVALLGVDLAGSGGGPLASLAQIVSEPEVSIWLFTFYALIATLPLLLTIEWTVHASAPGPAASSVERHPRVWQLEERPTGVRAYLPFVAALLIVVPGAVLTPVQLAPTLSTLYTNFGNVTAGDYELLSWAGTHLGSGVRVLVAPGSAGEFLPAYDPGAIVLYPMLPSWPRFNASYELVVSQLTNGTLTAAGVSAMQILRVNYVIVTEQNSILWPAVSPYPLFDSYEFHVVFQVHGAVVFEGPPPPYLYHPYV
jgi:hypothetical protein